MRSHSCWKRGRSSICRSRRRGNRGEAGARHHHLHLRVAEVHLSLSRKRREGGDIRDIIIPVVISIDPVEGMIVGREDINRGVEEMSVREVEADENMFSIINSQIDVTRR